VAAAPKPSAAPCGSCPYRKDVPSGVWHEDEYKKLIQYDGDILDQLKKGGTALFMCHQNDGHLCAGWAGCHDTSNLVALRLHDVDPSTFDYISPVPLFGSGAEAAAHGMAKIDNPDKRAKATIKKLARRKARKARSAGSSGGSRGRTS